MKKRVFYFLMILFIASCGNNKTADLSSGAPKVIGSSNVTVQSILSNMEKGPYKEGELLVKFKSGISASSFPRTHQALSARTIKKYSVVSNLEHVKLPQGVSIRDAITQYMSDPNVEYAEPNYVRCAKLTPNDPFFVNHQQWALNNNGQYAGGYLGADIKAPLAWDISTAGVTPQYPVIVAVIDTGVDFDHPDLSGNMWINIHENCSNNSDNDGNGFVSDCRGWNFVDDNNDPSDDIGHGTHVAGIIGAATNNGVGMAGVMWRTRIMPLKIFSAERQEAGGCAGGFVSDELLAIQYARDNYAKVINASFGQFTFCNAEKDAIEDANDILFVAAAGNGVIETLDAVGINNDVNPLYPASYNLPNIISVAATDQNDRLASFSSFGPNSVHVAAPGVYILSTVPFSGLATTFSSLCTGSFFAGYDFCSGTSMAAPHVSGLAGLLSGTYPFLTVSQVRGTIMKYVDVLPPLSGFIQTGGRINAYRALASLLKPTNLTATALSSSRISLSWTNNAVGTIANIVERKGPGDADFVQLAILTPDATDMVDGGLTAPLAASTTYTYRVRARNAVSADSFPSNEASATTLSASSVPPAPTTSSGGGGGGGCSVGAKRNAPTAFADTLVLLMPLLLTALLRRKRQ